FYRQLHFSPEGRIGRDYILKRGLPSGVVESQKLGYAPARWDGLCDHLKKNGIDPDLGVKAGLLSQGTNDSSKFFDRFRNRLIFPIKDERDRVVAFGGRSLSQDEKNEPKYLNSPETPIYHKGKSLYQYGVALESCRKQRQVLLVEGYMDLLAFHAKGFYRVVATLGTALTSHQVRLLSRICDEVVLAYDGDDAGEKAMLRALPHFLQEELVASCVRFPDGMDPDDFLNRRGLEELEKLVAHREELGAYTVRKALSAWDGTAAGRAGVFTELRPICAIVKQPLLRSEYLRLIADRFSISEDIASAQLLHEKGGRTERPQWQARRVNPPKAPETESLEEKVLRLMVRYPGLIECVRDSGALCCFRESKLTAIAEVLCGSGGCSLEESGSRAVYDLLAEQELQELYARYLLEPYELSEPEIQLRDWLNDLVIREAKLKRKELERSLQDAERRGDLELIRSILIQIRDLRTKTDVSDFLG
ncbi:MAG: toprim domain-containing protein, partial [Desulfobacteraceae bacterium]|nr:toprim domain-containing protein [Desulfobacteraceae bacterium]